MAPPNDMNAPAIGFLTLSIVLLLLLMLIWYRYLIWWNSKGVKDVEGGSRGSAPRSPSPSQPRDLDQQRQRRPRSPPSVTSTKIVPGMPSEFPRKHRGQPSVESMVGARDRREDRGREGPGMEDLEIGSNYSGRESRAGDWEEPRGLRQEDPKVGRQEEPREAWREAASPERGEERRVPRRREPEALQRECEPREETRRERRETNGWVEPHEDPQAAFRRNGRRVSFAGQESEVEPRDEGEELRRQRKEGHGDAEREYGEHYEQEHKRDAWESPNEGGRPGSRREDEREYRRNDKCPAEVLRVPGYSREEDERIGDSLEEGRLDYRLHQRPPSARGYRADYTEPTYGPHREDSLESIRSDEREHGSQKEAERNRDSAKVLDERHIRDDAEEEGLDLGHGAYPRRPDVEYIDALRYAEEDLRTNKVDGRGDMGGYSPPRRGGFGGRGRGRGRGDCG